MKLRSMLSNSSVVTIIMTYSLQRRARMAKNEEVSNKSILLQSLALRSPNPTAFTSPGRLLDNKVGPINSTGCPICTWKLVGLTFDFGVPPSCPAAQLLLTNSHQTKSNRADSRTLKIQVNPTNLRVDGTSCTCSHHWICFD